MKYGKKICSILEVNMSRLSIIIPAAGSGQRMKSYGPKALLPLGNGETLIRRQVNIVHRLYPEAEIIVVLGYAAEKIRKELPKFVKIVYNNSFDYTNVAYSISLGIKSTPLASAVLIIYGDLVFTDNVITDISDKHSLVITDQYHRFKDTEVGLTTVDNHVTIFSYGLPIKWAQISLLRGYELELFQQFTGNEKKNKMFGFEALNYIIEQHGVLRAIPLLENQKITEIDSSKDIDNIKRVI